MTKNQARREPKCFLTLKIAESGHFSEKIRRDGLQNARRRHIMQNCV